MSLWNCFFCHHKVTKNRFSGDVGKVPILFDKNNLTMSSFFSTPASAAVARFSFGKRPVANCEDIKTDVPKPINITDEGVNFISDNNAILNGSIRPLSISERQVVTDLKPLKHQSNINSPKEQLRPIPVASPVTELSTVA